MDKRYFMVPEVLLYLSVKNGRGGQNRVLIDDACGITYTESAGKMPVFGYKDVYFQKAAISKSLVSGVLMVNRSFKNAIGVLVTYFLNKQNTGPQQEATINDAKEKQRLTTVDMNTLTLLLGLLGDNRELLGNIRDAIPPSISLEDYNENVAEILSFISGNEALLRRYNVYSTILTASQTCTFLTADIQDYILLYDKVYTENNYSDFDGNIVKGQKQVRDLYNDIIKIYSSGVNQNLTSVTTATTELSAIISNAATQVARINSEVKLLQDTQARVSRYESILSESLFKDLNRAGLIVNLEVEYGRAGEEGSFLEVLEDCWFTSKALSSSTDNRDVIKDMYQFFARRIS